MDNNDAAVETMMIRERGLNAPRLTPDHIAAVIVSETYTTLPSGKVMVCELTLRNGYTVRGEAACVSRENFNEDVGRKVSRDNAVREIWQLEGYLLQQTLFANCNVFNEIKVERVRQDAQWGGPDHDDKHDGYDWVRYINRQTSRALDALLHPRTAEADEYRQRLVKIAALAVAAIESHDRTRLAKGVA